MTLFRKVFLNQSRPASPSEALDENALRDAFREMSSNVEPLVLDPFSRVSHGSGGAASVQTPGDVSEEQDDTEHLSDTFEEEEEEEEVASEEEGATAEAAEPDEEDATATVAGISAALHRAEQDRPEEDEAMEPNGRAELEEAEDHSPLSVAGDDPDDAAAQEPDAADAETFDVAAFAQRQMQALATANATPPAAQMSAAPEPEEASLDALPAPAAGRAGRRAGRVKTRLLGFNRADVEESDPFSTAAETTATAQREKFPVGWLVVVEGPGIGHSFSLFTGASMIGRGEDQVIRLDFGDNSISRQNHAAIAYDEEQNKFYLGHGGKSNIIRRNARPVLSTEELHHADLIRIGETTLRFVALCGSDFQWQMMDGSNAAGL
jgi:hypothetical protein